MKKALSILLAILILAAPFSVAASAAPAIGTSIAVAETGKGIGYDGSSAIINFLLKVKDFINKILTAIIEFFTPTAKPQPQPTQPVEPLIILGKAFLFGSISMNEKVYHGFWTLDTDGKMVRFYSGETIVYGCSFPSSWGEQEDVCVEYASDTTIIVIACGDERLYINPVEPLNRTDPYFLANTVVFDLNDGLWKGSKSFSDENTVVTVEKLENPADERGTVVVVTKDSGVYKYLLNVSWNEPDRFVLLG